MKKPIVKLLDISVFRDENEYRKAYFSVSAERRQKADFYRFQKDKFLSLGAGVLLQSGLEQLGITEYSLRYGEYGKPYLDGNDCLFFSLSHSGTMACAAFYDREIGIDIEVFSDISEDLIRRVTTDREYNYIISLAGSEMQAEFFRMWTMKESYMKYLGTGLSLPPTDLEIGFGNNTAIRHCGSEVNAVFEEYKTDGYSLMLCYNKEKF